MASDSTSTETSNPPHVGRLLGSYVLRSMDEAEARRVSDHLASCPLCAAEHAALTETVGLLRQYGPMEREP